MRRRSLRARVVWSALAVAGMFVPVACGSEAPLEGWGPGTPAPVVVTVPPAPTTTPTPTTGSVDAVTSSASTPAEPSGSTEPPPTEPPPTEPPPPVFAPNGQTVRVRSLDNSFRDEVTEVVVGTEILWTNDGRNEHNVLPVDDAAEWGVGRDDFTPGDEYRHVFLEPGTYPYYCSLHGTEQVGMVGTIVVTAS